MFVDDIQASNLYRGLNPNFVKRVWAKRREAEREERMARARRQAEKRREEQKALRERLEREKAATDANDAAVRELVAKYRIIEVEPQNRSARAIIREVAEIHGFSVDDILGVRRNRKLVEVRHLCMRAVADAKPQLSLPALGRIFNRDHTSLIHALKKTRKPGDAR